MYFHIKKIYIYIFHTSELKHMKPNILSRTSKERTLIFDQHILRQDNFSPLKNKLESRVNLKLIKEWDYIQQGKKTYFAFMNKIPTLLYLLSRIYCIAKISQFKTTMDQDISTNILMLGLLVSFSSFNRARKILLKSSLLLLSRMFHLKDVKKSKQLRVKMKNRTKQKKQATQKKWWRIKVL